MPRQLPDLSLAAPELAPALLGCDLLVGGVRARITETEAYQGEADRACHASKGRTLRTETLYAAPGTLYVYLCYGIHSLLNIVCDREGIPAAVLIRSVQVLEGEELVRRRRGLTAGGLDRHTNGPGKVTQALGIDRAWNRQRLGAGARPLHLVGGGPPGAIRRGPRVGVAYAGPHWAGRPWRFWVEGFPVARGG